jgi:hypothetical protein
MRKVQGPIFEYECHEGNYAMVGILSGHRADEKAAEEVKKGSSRSNQEVLTRHRFLASMSALAAAIAVVRLAPVLH